MTYLTYDFEIVVSDFKYSNNKEWIFFGEISIEINDKKTKNLIVFFIPRFFFFIFHIFIGRNVWYVGVNLLDCNTCWNVNFNDSIARNVFVLLEVQHSEFVYDFWSAILSLKSFCFFFTKKKNGRERYLFWFKLINLLLSFCKKLVFYNFHFVSSVNTSNLWWVLLTYMTFTYKFQFVIKKILWC